MSVPKHFRFTFRGVLGATAEQWSFGFHMSSTLVGSFDGHVSDIHEDTVTTACEDFFGHPNAFIPDDIKMTDWRAYEIGTDNRMVGDPLIHVFDTPLAGNSSAAKYPAQIACAVTLVGAHRGPARFGRFYLPTSIPIGGDRRVTAANALLLAEESSTFMKDVSNAIDLEGLTSASGVNISPGGGSGGTQQEIDHIEVGRVLDTLRNRRKSLVEERQSTGHIDW